MLKIGVMQGRLSPRPFPKLQAFPWSTWEKEFEIAAEIGLDSIEWMFEYDRYESNPIWSSEGRRKIKNLSDVTGVKTKTLCADYFLERPFFRTTMEDRNENIAVLNELIRSASEIGVDRILLPVLETAEIKTEQEKQELLYSISQCEPILKQNNIKLGFETELPAMEYLHLATSFDSDYIGIYYDAGNCAYKGYDMFEDMRILKDKIIGIHVKDRLVGGASVFLGEGDTNFKEGIPYLIQNGFCDTFILQTYFEHEYSNEIVKNKKYIMDLAVGVI